MIHCTKHPDDERINGGDRKRKGSIKGRMGNGGITESNKPSNPQPAQANNEFMESLKVGSRHRIQNLKETPAKGLQPHPTKSWAVKD